MSVVLAVDTTEDRLSLALLAGGRVRSLERRLKGSHDETLLPQVERLLRGAGLGVRDLDAIAAAAGPGRFTGIRIGMAYAAVAAWRLGIPAIAVSRLEALAFKTPGRLVCAVLPGYKDERYYQLFRRGRSAAGPPRPAGKPAWVDAAGWERAARELSRRGAVVAQASPGAADLLEPARLRLAPRRIPRFEPLYLKRAAFELSR